MPKLYSRISQSFAKGIDNSDLKLVLGEFANGYDLFNLYLTANWLIKGLAISMGVYDLPKSRCETLGGYGIHNTLKTEGQGFRLKLEFNF